MRGVLFDVDGVLLNSAPAHRRIWSAWAASVDLDFEVVWAASHGRRIVETLADVAPHLDPEVEEASIRRIMLAQGDAFPPMPGAAELLDNLPSEKWALVTSALAQNVRRRFQIAGLPLPKVLIDNRSVVRGKPHPEGYLAGASALGLTPRCSLVVEDAPAGVAAGKAAGMTVLAVATTHDPADLHDADDCVSSLKEADPLIRAWLKG